MTLVNRLSALSVATVAVFAVGVLGFAPTAAAATSHGYTAVKDRGCC